MRCRPPGVNTGILLPCVCRIAIIIFVPWPRLLIGAFQTWNSGFLRRRWQTGLMVAPRTDLGTVIVSLKRLHEVVRGPHACLFCRLHLPTSSCSNLWRNKISDRGGGLISAERTKPRGRTVRETLQHCCLLPYRPPERWGNDQKHFLNGQGDANKGNTFALRGSTAFFLIRQKYGR